MKNSQDESENDDQGQPLDMKPLRSLAPMFPTPLGYDVTTQSTDPMLVFVTPFRPRASPEQSAASFGQPLPKSPIPLKATPISAAFPIPRPEYEWDEDYKPFSDHKKPTSTSRKTTKRTQQAGYSDAANIKRRSTKRSLNIELASCPSSSSDPNESVEEIMMMFDSLRRRILQLDEKEDAGRRADLKAGTLMMQNGLRINNLKTIGPVPGVEIEDIFFFRIEMCIVGLHAPAMAGIDYISAKHVRNNDTLAVSIISSGGYENDDNDIDILVYTGQGGNSRHKEKHDQKLERGNLALMNSMKRKNLIRVVRSAQDPFLNLGKIYIYDGLYRVEDSWMDKAKNGFSVFKYKLRREPGQPDGISVWKMTEKWKANPATRDKAILLDLSSKVENIPVCLVNDVDDEKGPSYFNYVTGVEYLRPLSKTKPLQSCKCPSVCLPGDPNCSCSQLNGGDLPYTSSGLLVKHIPMLYECSSRCQCSQNCRNRVTQKGVYLNFEVFWTGDCGWGVRSWDPIRAGTFIW
jgi:[histone H3]-lysine9 N-dimethyltransferase